MTALPPTDDGLREFQRRAGEREYVLIEAKLRLDALTNEVEMLRAENATLKARDVQSRALLERLRERYGPPNDDAPAPETDPAPADQTGADLCALAAEGG